MTALTRRPTFWIAYALAAAIATLVALHLFPQAIPLVHLDITFSREAALAAALARAPSLELAPHAPRAAVRFANDETVQNYVELEGGGKAAFAKLVAGNAYAPYWWEVRLFAPGEVAETLLRFRPDGVADGFLTKVPETWRPTGDGDPALTADAARELAMRRAASEWRVDFAHYRALDATQQRRPNGRVDHLFTYERTDVQAGAARFRLRLSVSGNAFTGLEPFAFVPESFARRFQELRAANNTIAGVASLAAGLLYGLGGCVIALLWLYRQHWLQWRPALAAGLVVGALMGATVLSAAPTAWFSYDTAESVAAFWTRQVGSALAVLVGGGLLYALVFMAAESLSRRAFPAHPQLWEAWSREAAPSPEILGRTVGGYLFVGLELAFIAAFYYATNRWLGWWQPSETLTEPNILGTAVPALTPIAIALQAGFMEESLFRAVPLSLGALIGARYGRRGLGIAIAAVVQALVFGGAHANYPGFPAYSRLVELLLPSLVWALLFLRFGLVVTILLHALFDLALMSIPLFLIDAPGAGLQRALVFAAGLAPLGVVLLQRWRTGAWRALPMALRNAAWTPVTPGEAAAPARREAARAAGWIAAFQRALPVLGVLGLALWAIGTTFHADVPRLPVDRSEAIALAERALAARGFVPGSEWKRFATVRVAPGDTPQWEWHQFVWQEAGPEAYRHLVGNYLAPPLWDVRFARFEGDVAERAEEWHVTVDGERRVRQVRHAVPEARAGASLERDEALRIAQRAMRDEMHLDAARLNLAGADRKERPARRDWAFLFVDPSVNVGAGAEARAQVNIAGDKIAATGRSIHVPEAWERDEHERASRYTFVKLVLAGVTVLVVVAALVTGVAQWARRRYDRHAFRIVAGLTFAMAAVAMANSWPQLAMELKTAEPIATQVGLAAVGALVGGLFAALAIGLAAGIGAYAAATQPPGELAGRLPAWAAGIAAALLVAGVSAALDAVGPAAAPRWPTYGLASQAVPAVGAVIAGASGLASIGGALFLLAWLDRLTHGWQRHRWFAAIALIVVLTLAGLIGAQDPLAAVLTGLLGAVAAVVLVYGLLRFDLTTVPAYMTTGLVLGFAEAAARNATAGSYALAALAALVAASVAVIVTRYLERMRRAAQAEATTIAGEAGLTSPPRPLPPQT